MLPSVIMGCVRNGHGGMMGTGNEVWVGWNGDTAAMAIG
jgi:hypothetical protein